mmetsp:Transcript_13183/g.19957  ORF Transcript_13183/g.19957 Transcript_13183/m.19957 type:complete len:205 (+) Transcript_13183:925-1539(+)
MRSLNSALNATIATAGFACELFASAGACTGWAVSVATASVAAVVVAAVVVAGASCGFSAAIDFFFFFFLPLFLVNLDAGAGISALFCNSASDAICAFSSNCSAFHAFFVSSLFIPASSNSSAVNVTSSDGASLSVACAASAGSAVTGGGDTFFGGITADETTLLRCGGRGCCSWPCCGGGGDEFADVDAAAALSLKYGNSSSTL